MSDEQYQRDPRRRPTESGDGPARPGDRGADGRTGARLAGDSAANLIGSLATIAIALIAVPLYLNTVGERLFGHLTLIWLLLGHLAVLELGLGRALTNRVARMLEAPAADRQALVRTALWLALASGTGGALILWALAASVLALVPAISAELASELRPLLPWLAAAVPATTAGSVLLGALEGLGRFRLANLLQVSGVLLFQALPLVAAGLFGVGLDTLIPGGVLARILATGGLLWAVARGFGPRVLVPARPRGAGDLLAYGGWVSLTSLIAPVLEGLDRVALGLLAGAEAVARYTVAFVLADRLRVLPAALARALFPRLSRGTAAAALPQARQAHRRLCLVMALFSAPLLFLVGPFLDWWVGSEIAAQGRPVAQWILLGVWLNAPAMVPYVWLQASGRPDLVAKIHAAELVPYALLLAGCIQWYGAEGAAAAWALRVLADALLLSWAAGLPVRRALWPGWGAGVVYGAFLLAHQWAPAWPAALPAAALAALLALGWAVAAEPGLTGRRHGAEGEFLGNA